MHSRFPRKQLSVSKIPFYISHDLRYNYILTLYELYVNGVFQK